MQHEEVNTTGGKSTRHSKSAAGCSTNRSALQDAAGSLPGAAHRVQYNKVQLEMCQMQHKQVSTARSARCSMKGSADLCGKCEWETFGTIELLKT